MKPCSKNRKLIAWLALDELNAHQEQSLRAHIETCEGCRSYLEEVSGVTEKLAATEVRSDIQTSESFHQRVVATLRAKEKAFAWHTVVAQLSPKWLNRGTLNPRAIARLALPLASAAVVVIAALSVFVRRPAVPLPRNTSAFAAPTPGVRNDLDPTISNYQTVANRSLEKLDELLTRQDNRNPSPTPIYTASALTRATVSD